MKCTLDRLVFKSGPVLFFTSFTETRCQTCCVIRFLLTMKIGVCELKPKLWSSYLEAKKHFKCFNSTAYRSTKHFIQCAFIGNLYACVSSDKHHWVVCSWLMVITVCTLLIPWIGCFCRICLKGNKTLREFSRVSATQRTSDLICTMAAGSS